jgi:hypothetical protein
MSVGRKGPILSVRTWSLMAATTLALLMVAGSASAAEQFGATGKRGAWALRDSSANPAGLCIYGDPGPGGSDLDVVEARSPRVFARTPSYKRFAYDDAARGVGKRAWQAEYTGTPHFRVVTLITWYKPGTKSVIQGTTRLRYQWDATQNNGAEGTENDRCLPEP